MIKHRQLGVVRFFAAACILSLSPGNAQQIDFNRDIRPILSDRCFTCHGPDKGNRKTALRFDIEAGARMDLGKGRFAIVAGDPSQSELYRRITSDKPGLRMPPAYNGHERLSDREIDALKRWIEQGAKWEKHWSFIAPQRPALPSVAQKNWIRNPIDAFILSRLEREGLRPSPEADKETLLRRVALDLTGLPPSPAEISRFLNDSSGDAYEKLVDRLLDSSQYAERMAVRWLEAARYADTNGYQSDGSRSMWRWRDWVIDAFRKNMPFDQFTVEQIAGDLLPNATLDQKIASGFQRNHRTNAEGGIVPEEFRVEYVADRAETTSTVWLGLTMGCARCHDHKYDPISQKDFYRLFAFYNSVPENGLVYNFGNDEPYMKAPTPDQRARLEDLDRKAAAAEQDFAHLEPKLTKAQRSWEKKARREAGLDWSVGRGLVLNKAETMQFDGTGFVDAGDVAKFDYLEPFTVSAWIKPEKASGAILSRMEDYWEGEGYSLHLKHGRIRFHITKRFTDIGLRVQTEATVPLQQWTHVTASYDGHMKAQGVRIYINGKPQKFQIEFDQLNYPIAYSKKNPFRIGAGGGPQNRFHGAIEGVRVYKRALTDTEAGVLPLRETIQQIASQKSQERTKPQSDKLRLCFLEKFAPAEIVAAEQRTVDARAERNRFHDSIPTVMVMAEAEQPRDSFVLKRGAYDAPGEKVEPGIPDLFASPDGSPAKDRLGLAQWLISRSNPLTARVAVNRFWQSYFGVGLVKTSEDFGAQGEWPMHPELLDWLAVEFMDRGWDVKAMQKLIVTSATYRQSSKVSPQLLQSDPDNRLLARGPRFRLAAEVLRDQALSVSGLLVDKTGGPSVKPYQPAGLWQELAGGKGYQADTGEGLYRRSLYTYWKRTVPPPSMIIFDSPTRETCSVRQTRTNTPLQALNLMNDVAYLEAARKLGERMIHEGGTSPDERLQYGWRLLLVRSPKPKEQAVLRDAMKQFTAHFAAHEDQAAKFLQQGESPRDATLRAGELASYTAIASLMLNLDETVTKE